MPMIQLTAIFTYQTGTIQTVPFFRTQTARKDTNIMKTTFPKTELLKTRICPCCMGKLKLVKKYGAFNLASAQMLECKTCASNF